MSNTPHSYIISVLLIWIVFGGLLQLTNLGNYKEGDSLTLSNKKVTTWSTKSLTFIWDLMTFNINGLPSYFRISLTLFLSASLSLSIYVLLRSGS